LSSPLVVLDTMVVVSAVVSRPEGPSAAVVRAVATGELRLAISDDQLSELVRVMGYQGVESIIWRPFARL
jgi:predicted nucleic acid-binding protein